MNARRIPALLLAAALVGPLPGCGGKSAPDPTTPTTGIPDGGPYTGLRVSASSDLTGDGAPDVVISAPGAADDGGVYLFDAASTGTLGAAQAAASIVADQPGSVGEGLAACGDVDGDGNPDLAIGLPGGNAGRGGVWLLSGPLAGEQQTDAGLLIRGTEDDADSGYSVACGGDYDGDGSADLVFSSPLADGFGMGTGAGKVHFHVARDGSTEAIANFSTTFSGEQLGLQQGLDLRSDLDQDGLDDVVIGGPGVARLHVLFAPFSGTMDGNETGTRYAGREDLDSFGHSVATGDLDGDGYPEVVAGAPRYGPQIGALGIVYGPPAVSQPVIDPDRWIDGQDQREMVGFSLSMGDLDGDGLADILTGAPGAVTSGPEAGVAYGLLGPALQTAVFAADQVFVGGLPFAQLGHSVAVVPDANGDGSDEILIGAPYRDDGDRARVGAAFLFHSPHAARADDIDATATFLF